MTKKIMTALVSPFQNDRFDEESFRKLLEQQKQAQISGWIVNGTTAESPTLEWNEVETAAKIAHELKDKQKIIIGCGSNSTKKTIESAKKAEALGADALLVVVPYYNKPNQEGMYEHFKAVHDNTNTDIVLYNVPGRTVASLLPETTARLAKLDRVVSIKDATGDLNTLKAEKELLPHGFELLSGDDGTYMEFAAQGGHGCISVLSHVIPSEMVELSNQVSSDADAALEKYKRYLPLCDLLFQEPNPVPVKYALYKMGLLASFEVRLPLVSLSKDLQTKIEQELKELGLI